MPVAVVEALRPLLMSDKEAVLLLSKEGFSDSLEAGLPPLAPLVVFAAPESAAEDWGAVDGRCSCCCCCCCWLNVCGMGRIDGMAPGPPAAWFVAAAPRAPAHPPSAWSYERLCDVEKRESKKVTKVVRPPR